MHATDCFPQLVVKTDPSSVAILEFWSTDTYSAVL